MSACVGHEPVADLATGEDDFEKRLEDDEGRQRAHVGEEDLPRHEGTGGPVEGIPELLGRVDQEAQDVERGQGVGKMRLSVIGLGEHITAPSPLGTRRTSCPVQSSGRYEALDFSRAGCFHKRSICRLA